VLDQCDNPRELIRVEVLDCADSERHAHTSDGSTANSSSITPSPIGTKR
jgi:hypothetical protein